MLINEVCKECSLTKKAVEYYIEQGLISPQIQENGYRFFSDKDIERLNKIAILRGLGLSIADIRNVLSDQSQGAVTLNEIAGRKKLEITILQERQSLIQELADNHDWENVHDKLRQLEKRQSILERLMNVFPGYYGRYFFFHFALYLNEPIVTDEQQEAFETIIDFLDDIDFAFSDDLQKYFDETISGAAAHFENGIDGFAVKMSASMEEAVQNPDQFLSDNREIIKEWLAYKQSDEYKKSPAHCVEESLRQFIEASGYNDIFIPAMCRLSKSYREYHEALLKAEAKLSQQELLKDYFASLQ